MSDHPEVPRVTFSDDGDSMSIEQAVERFREILKATEQVYLQSEQHDKWRFKLQVEIRPCDCDHSFSGRDEYCPLHGDEGKTLVQEHLSRLLGDQA